MHSKDIQHVSYYRKLSHRRSSACLGLACTHKVSFASNEGCEMANTGPDNLWNKKKSILWSVTLENDILILHSLFTTWRQFNDSKI